MQQTLVSSPLPILDGRRFAIHAPAGWTITNRASPHDWVYTSYDFSLAPPHPSCFGSDPLPAEILQHGVERARLHGDLSGTRFRTTSGLRGVLHHAEFEPGERDWYFTVPIRRTESALIVRVIFSTGSFSAQRTFVARFFRTVRILPTTDHRA